MSNKWEVKVGARGPLGQKIAQSFLPFDPAQLQMQAQITEGLGERFPLILVQGTYRGEPIQVAIAPELGGREIDVNWIQLPTTLDQDNMSGADNDPLGPDLLNLELAIQEHPAYMAAYDQGMQAWDVEDPADHIDPQDPNLP